MPQEKSLEFEHVLDLARDYAQVVRYRAEGSATEIHVARAEARLQLACAVWARAHVAPVVGNACDGSCMDRPAGTCTECVAIVQQIADGYGRAAALLAQAMRHRFTGPTGHGN